MGRQPEISVTNWQKGTVNPFTEKKRLTGSGVSSAAFHFKNHGGKLMEVMTCILQGAATLLCVSLSVLIAFFIADFVKTEKRFKN